MTIHPQLTYKEETSLCKGSHSNRWHWYHWRRIWPHQYLSICQHSTHYLTSRKWPGKHERSSCLPRLWKMETHYGSLNQSLRSWKILVLYPPPDANLISARFVYNLKGNEHINAIQYCTHLVAQGYKQVEGFNFNFNDIFAPVARLESVCAICAMVAVEDDELVQTDIKPTFLYGCNYRIQCNTIKT